MIDIQLPAGWVLRGRAGDYILTRTERVSKGTRTIETQLGNPTYHATLESVAKMIIKEVGYCLTRQELTTLQEMCEVHKEMNRCMTMLCERIGKVQAGNENKTFTFVGALYGSDINEKYHAELPRKGRKRVKLDD